MIIILMYSLAEFCSGTGAFSLASRKTGNIKTIFANDICKNSKTIFDENNDEKLTLQDIHSLKIEDIPKMDILTGGFPCQPFSIAGGQLGFEDTRSNVFWKLLEIIKFHKPLCIILENVRNLMSHDKGQTFKIIIQKLEEAGYFLKYQILNTCIHTDIPQNRERIFIIGFLNKRYYENFKFPEKEEKTLELKDILLKRVNDKYYYKPSLKVYDKVNTEVLKDISTNTVYQYRRTIVRENKSNICPTLTANAGGGGHNVPLIRDSLGVRKLTPKECFILQGFPETYILPEKLSDSALYKLAGNAVTVKLVEKIFINIVSVIGKYKILESVKS